jgi:hypothetical protein
MRWTLAALVVFVLAGCGGSAKQLVVSRDGRAVLSDAYDGKLDRNWSCGSLRAAYRRLPPDPPTYSAIPGLIGDAAGKACDAAIDHVRVGVKEHDVAVALGMPDRTPRCWLYRWPPGTGGLDGARVCFANGRATIVQFAVHG